MFRGRDRIGAAGAVGHLFSGDVKAVTEGKPARTAQIRPSGRLRFSDGALKTIAKEALKSKTGARGLRSILESAMLDIMYELPSIPNLKEVVINEGVVLKNDKPELSYTSPEEQAARDVKKAETA